MKMTGTLRLQIAATLAGMAMVSGLVFQTSSAAFSDTTNNTGNSFTAGTVSLTDDDSGSALFNLSLMKPGDSSTKCIRVDYDGNLASTVKLYGAVGAGTLGQYLNLTINSGTGPANDGSCASFVAGNQIYNGTVSTFASTYAAWGSGLTDANFVADDVNDYRTYRIVVSLQDNNSAQGLSATGVSFTWEAQNN